MFKKKSLWHGLTCAFAILLAIVIIVSQTLESFSSAVDAALGTQSYVLVSDDGSNGAGRYTAYTPDIRYLNEDGSMNSKALIGAAIELGRKESAEGSVLLKNNGVLPLAQGSKVTLLGIRSVYTLLGAGTGAKVTGPVIPLADALSKNSTDFRNKDNWAATGNYSKLDDYTFEGAGFSVNPTMIEVYTKANEKSGLTVLDSPSDEYDPKEPSLADLSEANPDYKASFATYGDAAIVVIGRPGAEGQDYLPGGVASGTGAEEPLQLTTNEKDTIKLATDNFDKVIVLVNTACAMEIDELKRDDNIDAILFIGYPGCYGNLGVADILCGRVSPSGGLYDIYAANNLSAPAMQNMGSFSFSNADELARARSSYYLIEAEGIYVGYRYYETRYYDTVLDRGNATSSVGVYASSDEWNYEEEVTYGFGYGLSYTTFSRKIEDTKFSMGENSVTADFSIKVKNTGNVPGKTTVQLYGQAPYYEGGIEKSAIQLLAFEKTKILEPGEEVTLLVSVDLQYLASYDSTIQNADGTCGRYILDGGDYYFAVGNGAHDALNNILAKQGFSASTTTMDYDGNPELAYEWKYSPEGGVDRSTFAVSKTGVSVSNQLDYSDWNYYEGASKVTYLSRSDWAGTYPVKYADLAFPISMKEHLEGNYYTANKSDDTSEFIWGSTETALNFYDLAGKSFDDPLWEDLLDQVALEEAMLLLCFGGPQIPSVESVGFLSSYICENGANGIAVGLNMTETKDAPWSVESDDNNAAWNPTVFASGPILASSFNPKLYEELGEFIANEALFTGVSILWGPGLNTHRHAYNGRNGEYYSEDPVLSGVVAMEYSVGAMKYGLITAAKHYAFNDQETNRYGVAPFMTEQRAREVELRAYQIAVEAKKYDTEEYDAGMHGVMTSFSKIGAVECTCSRELVRNILHDEWGFVGYVVTDIYDDTDLYISVIRSGVTGYDVRGTSAKKDFVFPTPNLNFAHQANGVSLSTDMVKNDAELQESLKYAVKNLLWVFANSSLVNRFNTSSHLEWNMTWWRGVYIGGIAVASLLLVAAGTMFVLVSRKEKGEKKKWAS